MGLERKLPKPFMAACDKFIFTEILHRPATGPAEVEAVAGVGVPSEAGLGPLGPALMAAITVVVQEDGWAHLDVRLREG